MSGKENIRCYFLIYDVFLFLLPVVYAFEQSECSVGMGSL